MKTVYSPTSEPETLREEIRGATQAIQSAAQAIQDLEHPYGPCVMLTQPIQCLSLCSYVLVNLQVLVNTHRQDAKQLSAAIANFQKTSLYSQCRTAIASNTELVKRWDALGKTTALSTPTACDEYALKCHQLYGDLATYFMTQVTVAPSPAQTSSSQKGRKS